jgi:hypothetical protein
MKLKYALAGLLALGTVGLAPQVASALPNGLPHANQLSNVEQVRWVCNPWGRCWWRPNHYRAYGFYPPPPRFRPWRAHRHHWRHW